MSPKAIDPVAYNDFETTPAVVAKFLATDTNYRAATFIETYTGRAFWPLHPTAAELSVIDIAHALSNQCRYTGHVQHFYCPTMDQRVLTDDLKWVAAGDLKRGDGLVGFDEYATELGGAGKARRRLRPAHVLTATQVHRRIIRLELSDGSTIRSSSEHPWLIATKMSRNQTWATAEEIMLAVNSGRNRYMHKFIEPWSYNESREAGWLAGLYDGEGHLSVRRTGVQLGLSQKPGLVLSRAELALANFGFAGRGSPTGDGGTTTIQMAGGWREVARLLGSVRPTRLLNKFNAALMKGDFAKQMHGDHEPLRIVKCYEEGEDWCAGLETNTRTYLCEGYGAHNSVAQHCCLLASWLANRGGSALDCLQILMHDSPEAYLVDIARPVKQYMPEYRVWDHAINDVIREWMGWKDLPMLPIQDEIDSRIIVDERAQLMDRARVNDWGHKLEPLGIQIEPWSPTEAEKQFLMMYAAYSKEVYGSYQYINYTWNLPVTILHETNSDMLKSLDVMEADVKGRVARVRLRDDEGILVRDPTGGVFPRPQWKWVHGDFEIAERG